MRVLYLSWSDYEPFLQWLYGTNPGLTQAPYAEQLARRNDSLFGTTDAYPRSFKALGHEASQINVSNIWLQTAWAREHGMAVSAPPLAAVGAATSSRHVAALKRLLQPYRALLRPITGRLGLTPQISGFLAQVLRAQIEDFRPDVVINDNIEMIDGKPVRDAAGPDCFLISQIGLDPPKGLDLSPYNMTITMMDWVTRQLRDQGHVAEQVQLAFEPTVLEKLGPPPTKDVAVSFVGGLGASHGRRQALLETIAERFPLEIWGPNLKDIPRLSPLHKCYRGEAWGAVMYNILRRSKITLNGHINAARGEPVNMRMYEATGVGAFLLTDNVSEPDQNSRFGVGMHVAGYTSAQDCLEKMAHYLAADEERDRIAAAGQAHTLQCHTYRHRAAEILAHVARYSP